VIRSSLVLSLTQIAEAWVGTALHDYASQRLSSLTLFNTSEIGTGTPPRLLEPCQCTAVAGRLRALRLPGACLMVLLQNGRGGAALAAPEAGRWPPQPVPDSEAAWRPEDSPASSSQARWPGPDG